MGCKVSGMGESHRRGRFPLHGRIMKEGLRYDYEYAYEKEERSFIF